MSAIRKNNRDGFTLIELVCVITIMSILFGVVFFGMDSLTAEQRLKADARKLIGFIESARNIATSERRCIYVVYDLEDNVCFICDSPGKAELEDIDTDRQIRFYDGNALKEIKFAGDASIENKSVQLSISALGDVESHAIVLEGKEESMTIEVNGVTGVIIAKNTSDK